MHAIQPTWLHRDHWHASRVNAVDKTVVIEHADQQAIIGRFGLAWLGLTKKKP